MARLLMVESWLGSSGRAFAQALHDQGHQFLLATRDPELYGGDPAHPALVHADDVMIAETHDHAALVTRVARWHATTPFAGVVTTCDYYLEAVAVVAEALGLAGPAPAAVRVAMRKHLVREASQAAELANPRFAVARTPEEACTAARSLGWPLIAKPVDLNAGTAVRRVEDDAGLAAAVTAIQRLERNSRGQPLSRLVLLEEVLVGQEVSVEAVTVGGRTSVLGITDKSITGEPALVESGHMFPARLEPATAQAVEDCVRRALEAVGNAHGLSHTEVMVTAGNPRIVEINPRQGGNHIFELVRHVIRVDVFEIMVDLAVGQLPRSSPPTGDGQRPASAAIFFLMAPLDADVDRVTGTRGLDDDPRLLRWEVTAPVAARRPRDNDDYLGHVLTIDRHGSSARAAAEAIVAGPRLCCADGSQPAPLGVPSGLV